MIKSRLIVFLHLALLFEVVRLQCVQKDPDHKYGCCGPNEYSAVLPADTINETDSPPELVSITWKVSNLSWGVSSSFDILSFLALDFGSSQTSIDSGNSSLVAEGNTAISGTIVAMQGCSPDDTWWPDGFQLWTYERAEPYSIGMVTSSPCSNPTGKKYLNGLFIGLSGSSGMLIDHVEAAIDACTEKLAIGVEEFVTSVVI